ncbi:MAG: flagellar biosynthesis protein FliQ [Firmicutes bacterium]|nr:flagellar biosynthesis protein FliQ [Bacillota bacterium]
MGELPFFVWEDVTLTELTIARLAKDALATVLLVAGPILGLSLIVGLVVSIFQATTQIQEQTLAFVPKILTVLVATVILGPWMLRVMMEFTTRLLGNMNQFIG